MAKRSHSDDDDQRRKLSDDYLSTTISSSTLEIVLDDQSCSNSDNEESNSQDRSLQMETSSDDRLPLRRRKQLGSRTRQTSGSKRSSDASLSGPKKDPKSHRLIEKRRRDRMNACLGELLEITPHENLDTQRRIEKTEIIEMAIKHMRHLISTAGTPDKKSIHNNLETYRLGYQHSLSDVMEYLEKHSGHEQLLIDLTDHIKAKESDLKNLTAIPCRKRLTISIRPDKQSKAAVTSSSASSSSSTKTTGREDLIDHGEDKLCVISDVEECKPSGSLNSIEVKPSPTPPSDPPVKVPIFVLHPSGTHYIPMSIDASIVSHAFSKTSSFSRSTSSSSLTNDPIQCHPVSIPVNFNPIGSLSDPYELDIQNINVIGTRHQTSVRPN